VLDFNLSKPDDIDLSELYFVIILFISIIILYPPSFTLYRGVPGIVPKAVDKFLLKLFKAFNKNGTLYLAFNKKAHEIGILPDDIIVIEKLEEENQYKLENYKPSMPEYDKILLNLNGKKSLVSIYHPSF
jgi:hypothetical protein